MFSSRFWVPLIARQILMLILMATLHAIFKTCESRQNSLFSKSTIKMLFYFTFFIIWLKQGFLTFIWHTFYYMDMKVRHHIKHSSLFLSFMKNILDFMEMTNYALISFQFTLFLPCVTFMLLKLKKKTVAHYTVQQNYAMIIIYIIYKSRNEY